MKKLLIFAFAVVALSFTSCNLGVNRTDKGDVNSDSVELNDSMSLDSIDSTAVK